MMYSMKKHSKQLEQKANEFAPSPFNPSEKSVEAELAMEEGFDGFSDFMIN